jgi:transcriptional regulator with XRE-family HTH domain
MPRSRSHGPSARPANDDDRTASAKDQGDWPTWMRALGRQERRVREFLGLSQQQLARAAGVSQGAVSRLEAGRGLATPMLVILKINLALRRAIRTLDPGILNDDLRRVLDIEDRLSPPAGDVGFEALPLTRDPDLEELVRLYRDLPERQRQAFFAVARATAGALAVAPGAAGEHKPS